MNRKLYVANLATATVSQELEELFSQAGQVLAITVVRDDITGRERKVAYVEMRSHDGARAAVARFDQYPLRGLPLTVRESGVDDPPPTESRTMLDEGGALRAED